MKYLNRYAIVLSSIFILYFIFSYYNFLGIDDAEPTYEMIDSFQSLKLKIEYLKNQVESKQNDINSLKEAFASNVFYYNNLVQKQKEILDSLKNETSNLYDIANLIPILINQSEINPEFKYDIIKDKEKLRSILLRNNIERSVVNTTLSKLTDQITNNEIEFPKIVEFLPHLSSKQANSLQPKFKLSKNRRASIVIGIPTIKREKTSYLLETIKSLLDAMNELEKSDALIVVMIAEIDDAAFVQKTIELITKAYKYEINSGLLDIIVPPVEFYPNLNQLSPDKVFNDSSERVRWRTKQNYDFSYLMTYAQKRGGYYLQLEDDVVSKSGFFTIVKQFIKSQKRNEWMMIEFSQLGFIGKLFKSRDLPMFVNFFLMFASDKPVDWLFESVFDVKICNPEKGSTHCQRSKSDLKVRYKPSLFQHVGLQSSLKGKTQNLKDKDFGQQQIIIAHNNPPAHISTSLKTYMKYSLESVYLGHNYFWSMSPVANDFILFELKEPMNIFSYYIKSGNPEHPDDRLYNATLHIKTVDPIPEAKVPSGYIKTSDGFWIIDKFSNELGIVSGEIDPKSTGKIAQIRIHIPNSYETWIIITEINFSSKPNDPKNLSSKPNTSNKK